jgi:putative tricarboxylic transport membrane protein
MLDLIQHLGLGFGVVFSTVDLHLDILRFIGLPGLTIPVPMNIFLCLVGAMVGTLIGVLPGVGPLATIAMLLPITFGLPPVGALIMLAGIYYGAQYGGSTTSILINIPGESSSVMTCLDGNQMARQGRAGPALAIAAIGSFFAGCVSTVLVAALGAPLTSVALLFGPAEYFALMTLGLCFAVVLARGSILKALAMVLMGLLMSMVGSDIETGQSRMAFDIPQLSDGISFVTIAMGVFGFAEIMRNLETSESREILKAKLTGLMPTWPDLKASAGAIGRGTLLGSILGILPGGGAVIASFAAYTFEKKSARAPSRFGRGAIEGVASPESANNAAAQTSFIPLLTLGIPPNAVMALMVGAMTIHGIVPGPQVMTKQPDLFWGMVTSMWVGNLMLIVINLPMVGMWVKLLQVPYRFLFPAILIFCSIGVYSINNSPFDCVLTAAFGLVGYWLVKHDFEPAPMLLGFVLGPLMEENLRRAMLIARGDPSTFVTRPISGSLIGIALVLLIVAVLPTIARKREEVFVEE